MGTEPVKRWTSKGPNERKLLAGHLTTEESLCGRQCSKLCPLMSKYHPPTTCPTPAAPIMSSCASETGTPVCLSRQAYSPLIPHFVIAHTLFCGSGPDVSPEALLG